jgi:hypothetical protein
MSDSRDPDLRPARPTRRRRAATESAPADDVNARLGDLEAVVRNGFDALERHLQGSAGGDGDRLEEVVELLEAAIDHLVSIERRLGDLEQHLAPAPHSKKKATATAPAARARRTRKASHPDA